ncbi:MAG: glycosyltransferase family 2 protein [Candidatus Promineifilaceae bacterium]|nr:glycosyltransferase family 2 protein [Candidatus Promineifilaceae bacterium]
MNKRRANHVLAIVLNWQQPRVTLACVDTLSQMNGQEPDILIIDNGSQDDSLNIFCANKGGFKLSALPQNTGFATGINHGLRMALEEGYDFALMVNNDAFADARMLEQLLLEAAPDIALLSPKIFYEKEPDRIWFANGRQHPITLDLLDTGKGELDGPKWQNSHDVDYLLGTCLLVNLDAVREVGLLDERYYFYFEDLDWSLRFRRAGYRLRVAAGAHLYHRVALSTGGAEDSPLRRYHLAKSSVRFWHRNAGYGWPWAIFIFRALSAVKTVARLHATGHHNAARAYVRGLRDGWRESKMD